SPTQCALAHHRLSRAGAGLGPGHRPAGEAPEAGSRPGAASLAAPRGGPPARRAPLAPPPSVVPALDAVPRAAETPKPRRLAGLGAGADRAAARPLHHGSSALGGPLHTGVAQSGGGAKPDGAPLRAVHLPARVYAALDGSCLPDTAHAESPPAPTGNTAGA